MKRLRGPDRDALAQEIWYCRRAWVELVRLIVKKDKLVTHAAPAEALMDVNDRIIDVSDVIDVLQEKIRELEARLDNPP